MKVVPMLRLFQAGAIAAGIQCVMIAVLSPLVILYGQYQIEDLKVPNTDMMTLDAMSWLQLAYLVIAVGLASTKHRFVDVTAMRIRGASRRLHPSGANHTVDTLLVCLLMAAIGFAALTLRSPPAFLTGFGWHFGASDAAPIIWSAIMSVGVASFGANAHATAQAAREVRR
jgi:hypothetical protein